ncbi:Endonuclease-reverse transcriptase, partial [Operophtera brumata]
MDEVMNALKAIKKELNEQRQEIRETGKNVTDQVTQNINSMFDEKFLAWEHKHEKLKEIVENQEKRIYYLEKQERKRNLVFFGIEETETSYASLEKNMINWVEQYFSIKLPRPIVVIFSTLGTKIKILKQKEALKDTHYYFKEDFPKQVLEKRRELQEQVKLEKEKGNIVKIKYDKL